MMTYDEYISISSEIKQLKSLLAEIPQGNVLQKMSLETRLNAARNAIANVTEYQLVHKARLTFKGKPVIGTHGIVAEFASKAAGAFTDAVSAIAAGLEDNLNYMGPIPDRQKNQLLITGTAIGSFGFEFELPRPLDDGWFPNRSGAEDALDKIKELFRLASEGEDDEIAELINEIHPRAVKKTAEFLTLISQHEAWCGLEFKHNYFTFKDIDQLRASAERLKEDNIHILDDTFNGQFQGILPTGRTFEFKLEESGKILRGKVAIEIEDPAILNRNYLDRPVKVKLQGIQVGQGRPRYSLVSLENIVEL